jgi:hypothetical protein
LGDGAAMTGWQFFMLWLILNELIVIALMERGQ